MAAGVQADLRSAHAGRGEAQAAGVECYQRDLEPAAFLSDQVLLGDAHVVEGDHPVCERSETHESATMLYRYAFGGGVHDEGADLMCLGVRCHHYDYLGEGTVRAPELLTIENIGIAFGSEGRGGAQSRWVGAHVLLGERESRYRA